MKVLIAPLFPRQFEWLKQVYSGPHDLEFMDSAKGEGPKVLETKARRADKVVVLTKFISHAHWDNLPREKLIHCDSVNLDRMLYILDQLPDDTVEQAPPKEPKTIRVVRPAEEQPRKPPMSTSTTREVKGFVLTTAVPIPDAKKNLQPREPAYPLAEMKPGESFWLDTKDKAEQRNIASRISVAASYLRKKDPHLRFKTSVKQEGGVRCWRLPNYTDEEVAEQAKTPPRRYRKSKRTTK